ncbi:SubName: Full=Uncharacterized protein {ECO:0000313/EMBL:CCA70688.1} [Serendipita indica DSM 11827]|uniref:CCHC-type domain-containing protein n=1 Tax=Serendipita indica (strain DSM 11827) TaxID=1109443 RepID=G4TH95_SERID|nr:SubName: Full=Uncharacterized protein {ECO:0000313/EMBL:CCA70688.1} [Serendipita indica DSM 11827]CCA70688.1 hypothetical protein PIIN_04622 [Serendipita indica DSM 11827]
MQYGQQSLQSAHQAVPGGSLLDPTPHASTAPTVTSFPPMAQPPLPHAQYPHLISPNTYYHWYNQQQPTLTPHWMTPNVTYPLAYQHFMDAHQQPDQTAANRIMQLEQQLVMLQAQLNTAMAAMAQASAGTVTPRSVTTHPHKVNKLQRDEHLGSWKDFCDKLAAVYGIHDEAGNARVQLDKLEQGDKSVAEYSAKFEELVAFLDELPESERIYQYRRGLNYSSAKIVALEEARYTASGPPFPTLQSLINFCKRHDDSMAALRLTHPPKPKQSHATISRSTVQHISPTTSSHTATHAPTPPTPRPPRDPYAMNIGAARQDTRKCYNCDIVGHLSRDCTQPRKPRTVQVKASNVDPEELEHRQVLRKDAEESIRKELEAEMSKKFEERMAAYAKQTDF